MKRYTKLPVIFFVFLLAFSLIGCSSNTDTKAEGKKEAASASSTKEKAKKDSANTSEQDTKAEQTQAPVQESQPAQAAVPTNTNQPSTASSQSSNSQQNTASSTNQSAAAKPAAPAGNTAANTNTAASSNPPAATTPPPAATQESQKPAATVTLSIVGPKDRGTIVAATEVSISDGETVYNVLKKEADKKGIAVDSRGSGAALYIEGIDNFYEFDYGSKSGWTIKQNGASLTKSAGVTSVKAGDRIEFVYVQ